MNEFEFEPHHERERPKSSKTYRNRMFEQEALHKVVMDQLVNVPKDHKVAVVTVVNQDGMKTVFAFKPKDHWQVESYVELKHDHGLNYGASVAWSK